MDILERLELAGWSLERRDGQPLRLPPELIARHPAIPASLLWFLDRVSSCINAKQTAWFLCEADFCGTSDSAFRWDEWEQLSLESVGDDAEWASSVRAFWDVHLPFLLSVEDGYAYHAIATSGDNLGKVVFGREPEFEEADVVAESFEEFLGQLANRPAN